MTKLSKLKLALVALSLVLLAPSAWAAKSMAKAVYDDNTKTMTFYYDDQTYTNQVSTGIKQYDFADYPAIEGTEYPGCMKDIPWLLEGGHPATNVTFDVSFANYQPKGTACWFVCFKSLKGITGIENLNTSSVTNMTYMFGNCSSLTALDLSNFDARSCMNTRAMFSYCSSLTKLDMSHFDTKNVATMATMFNGCSSLTELDVSGFNTANVTNVLGMFASCSSLTKLNVSGFDTTNVKDMSQMFKKCSKLVTIFASGSFKTDAVTSSTGMFTNCTELVASLGTTYSPKHTDKTYARIDGGASAPGYFTAPPPSTVTVADVTGAKSQIFTSEGEITVRPAKITYGKAFDVVYTITNTAYMFPGGYKTFTTNLTANTESMTVSLTAAQQPVAAAACTDCLTFSADAAFGIKMTKQGTPSEPKLEYSQDQVYWSKFDLGNVAAAGADNKLYLRGTGNTAFAAKGDYYAFTNTLDSAATAIACSGNIMTLLDYQTVARGDEPTMDDCAFYFLFKGFAALTTAPELPATTLTNSCYYSMFQDCTALTAAPELPATNLADKCYMSMFRDCTSLMAAPELPETNLVENCYGGMFSGCTSLMVAPELAATTLPNGCYAGMFKNCTSLTSAPELPATILTKSCYDGMFDGCTALTAVPELPATNSAVWCCRRMFNGCTSLTTVPKLPATNLERGCYDSMFQGCTSLTDVPTLLATNLAMECYRCMFSNCTALVVNTNGAGKAWSIPADADVTDATKWNTNMFAGVSGSITNAPTSGQPTPGVTYYIVEPVKIPAAPAVVAHTTKKIYLKGEEVTDGQVWSNRTENVASPADPVATVVYTADAGYAFADGTTEKTVQLDTRVNPAVLLGDAPAAPEKMTLKLGVVAQRYPWNGIVDVNYKTTYWPATKKGAVEITIGESVTTNTFDIAGSGTVTDTAAINLKATAGEFKGTATFKAIVK